MTTRWTCGRPPGPWPTLPIILYCATWMEWSHTHSTVTAPPHVEAWHFRHFRIRRKKTATPGTGLWNCDLTRDITVLLVMGNTLTARRENNKRRGERKGGKIVNVSKHFLSFPLFSHSLLSCLLLFCPLSLVREGFFPEQSQISQRAFPPSLSLPSHLLLHSLFAFSSQCGLDNGSTENTPSHWTRYSHNHGRKRLCQTHTVCRF